MLEGLSDPAGAQLFASLKEVLRISEGQSTPSMAKVCEQIIAKTGNVAGNSLDCMLNSVNSVGRKSDVYIVSSLSCVLILINY